MEEHVALDGSTVEAWMGCPYAAKQMETKRAIMPGIVEIGNEIHHALGMVVRMYCENAPLEAHELRQELERWLRESRPDVQPEVLRAARASLYSWCNFIAGIDEYDILGFDGGEHVGRSGQLSTDVDGIILTSEVDLLYRRASQEVLYEIDYKTGHRIWDAQEVADSGQFQRHAILVFANWPNVQALECKVWNVRTNNRTYAVTFERRRLEEYVARVKKAVENRRLHYDKPPTWPTYEGCSRCHWAKECPATEGPIKDIDADPAEFVRTIHAVQARLDSMLDLATKYADKHGTIDCGDCAFGRDAPKTERRAPAKLYPKKDGLDG